MTSLFVVGQQFRVSGRLSKIRYTATLYVLLCWNENRIGPTKKKDDLRMFSNQYVFFFLFEDVCFVQDVFLFEFQIKFDKEQINLRK